MGALDAGCELLGNNHFIGIIDREGMRAFKKNLVNNLSWVRDTLEPIQSELIGISVESTYNCYGLLAEMLRLGILPEGHIYPNELQLSDQGNGQ